MTLHSESYWMYRAAITATAIGLLALSLGCGSREKVYPEKSPLPVTVMRLETSTPQSARLYSGSVRSWKVEDIAFEVNGRVKWVVEPGGEIDGRTYKVNGDLLSPGTQVAQLDDERFLTALASAKSKVQIEILKRDSTQLQIDESLPAEIASAKAQYDLAVTEFQRNQRLVAQNAGARKNLDSARAALDEAKATLDGTKTKLLLTKADLKSAEAEIEQALQAQKDTQLDLDNTKLYSAFRGQVAEIFVVPGSLATNSSKIATVQMMNPIKVELEVSAATSRQMKLSEVLMLTLSGAGGKKETVEASVYAISPSADNATRTFTLTLLAVNKKIESKVPAGIDVHSVATTPSLWRVDLGILPSIAEGTYYMPENGLHTDSQGEYVWRVTNFKSNEPTQRVLKVVKLYVKDGGVSVPFLGKSRFRTVTILPNQPFDPSKDLFASHLFVHGQQLSDWEGDTMLLYSGSRWLMRPGDVVEVDLTDKKAKPGLFVPAGAIQESSGRISVFVVETDRSQSTVREVKIRILDSLGSRATSTHRVESAIDSVHLEGKQIVVEGVHYLIDGQSVVVTADTQRENR